MWREIPNYDGRYLINQEGDVLDLRPVQTEQHWTTPINQRLLVKYNGSVALVSPKGKTQMYLIKPLLRKIFADILLLPQEKLNEIKEKSETQESITYDIEDLNKLLWPNKILKMYDKTYNVSHHIDPRDRRRTLWEKPIEVPIVDGKITFEKGHTYFGYGLTHIIYIKKNMIPYNGKPFKEPFTKSYMRKYSANKEKTKHTTEIW